LNTPGFGPRSPRVLKTLRLEIPQMLLMAVIRPRLRHAKTRVLRMFLDYPSLRVGGEPFEMMNRKDAKSQGIASALIS
jgi:hypothetical protein